MSLPWRRKDKHEVPMVIPRTVIPEYRRCVRSVLFGRTDGWLRCGYCAGCVAESDFWLAQDEKAKGNA